MSDNTSMKLEEVLNVAKVHRETIHNSHAQSMLYPFALMVGYFLEAIFRQLENIEYEIIAVKGKMHD